MDQPLSSSSSYQQARAVANASVLMPKVQRVLHVTRFMGLVAVPPRDFRKLSAHALPEFDPEKDYADTLPVSRSTIRSRLRGTDPPKRMSEVSANHKKHSSNLQIGRPDTSESAERLASLTAFP